MLPFRYIIYESESHSVVSDSLWPHGLYSPWNSPGQNTRVGSLSILQGIFLTQGLKPGLPHCRQTLYQLCHKGSPRILEWVTYLFPSGSSRPRNRTRVSCIAGGFFTSWASREACVCMCVYTYQFSSVVQLCLTLFNSMDCSMPGFPVHHQHPEPVQTHAHWVSNANQPSHTLSSPSIPDFNLSQHQGLFRWVSSSHQVAKVLELQLQHQSFQWIFKTDFP